jgi:hypothetical protein
MAARLICVFGGIYATMYSPPPLSKKNPGKRAGKLHLYTYSGHPTPCGVARQQGSTLLQMT